MPPIVVYLWWRKDKNGRRQWHIWFIGGKRDSHYLHNKLFSDDNALMEEKALFVNGYGYDMALCIV